MLTVEERPIIIDHESLPPEAEPLVRLGKDLKEAAGNLGRREARYLVDLYYMVQEDRKRANNQIRATVEAGEPSALLSWVAKNMETLETDIRSGLGIYAKASPIGRWSLSVYGIGPVIAAGLLAHIDVTKAPTAGHIWRFAGLDPTLKWEPHTKRPWNASLKVICWKAGDSFVKFSNRPECRYGAIYRERKTLEVERNEAGTFSEQAARTLAEKHYKKDTEAYKAYFQGKLPAGHIDARARRYAVKLFLSHWHEMAYRFTFGIAPPLPYPIAILGHAHVSRPE